MTGAHPAAAARARPGGRAAATAGYLGAGLAAGVLAKLADLLPGGEASAVASGLAVWVLLLAVIARFSPRPREAAIRAALFFLGMVTAYYAVTVLVLHYLVTPRLVIAWGVAALTACPAVAWVLHWALRSRRIGAAVVVGLVAGRVFVDGALQRVLLVLQQPDLAVGSRPLAAVVEVVAAVLIAAVLPRFGRTRLLAAGIAIITAVVLLPVIDRLVSSAGFFS